MLTDHDSWRKLKHNAARKCRNYQSCETNFNKWFSGLEKVTVCISDSETIPLVNVKMDELGAQFTFLNHSFLVAFLPCGEEGEDLFLQITFHEYDPLQEIWLEFYSHVFEDTGNAKDRSFYLAEISQFRLFILFVLNDWMAKKFNMPDK